MICPYCKAEVGDAPTCPNCGAPIPPADPAGVLTKVFADIRGQYGREALGDGNYLYSVFAADPTVRNMLPLLDAFLRVGGNGRLLAADAKSIAAEAQAVAADMNAASGLHPVDCAFICDCFSRAVNPPAPKKKSRLPLILLLCLIALALAAGLYFGIRWFRSRTVRADELISVTETDDEKHGKEADEPDVEDKDREDEDPGHLTVVTGEEPASESSEEAPAEPTPESSSEEPAKPAEPAAEPAVEKAEETPATEEPAPAEEAPAEKPKEPTEVIETGAYRLTLTGKWANGEYPLYYEVSGTTVNFYEKASREAGFGGFVFGINLFDDDYTQIPSYRFIGRLFETNGEERDVVAIFPSDVQFIEEATELYTQMYEDYLTVAATLEPLGGRSFEPGARLTCGKNACYLFELYPSGQNGTLWFHETPTKFKGITHVEDFPDAEMMSGPVMDSRGNEYLYGLHVDGAGANEFTVAYALRGQYTVFRGTAAPSVAEMDTSDTKFFQIYGDGVLLYTSPMLKGNSAPESFELDVTGVQEFVITYPPTVGGNDIAVLFDGVLY